MLIPILQLRTQDGAGEEHRTGIWTQTSRRAAEHQRFPVWGISDRHAHPLGEGKDVAEVPTMQRAAPIARDPPGPEYRQGRGEKASDFGGLLFQAPHSTCPLSSLQSFTCL